MPLPTTRTLKRGLLALLCILVITEISLRSIWGFGDAVLYREDPDFEYIAIPQDRTRFGNSIFYNSFSQRSPEPTDEDSIIIDGFGDSVLNGGTQLDDDSLATTKLSAFLSKEKKAKVTVLNISSQSWGPGNCYAYLKQKGDFHASAMFYVASSHDVYDNISFQKVVDLHPGFPSHQYPLAILEVIDRYILPRLKRKSAKLSDEGAGINKRTNKSVIDPGFTDLANFAREHNLPFFIYHHADAQEYRSRKYNADGQTLDSLCRANNIALVRELDYDITEGAYRDNIHLSAAGQEQMYRILREKIMTETKALVHR